MLSAEARILLLSAAGRGQDATLAAWLDRPLDWPLLLGLAHQQRATSALWKRLQHVCPERVPAEAAETLRKAALIAEFRQASLEERLRSTIATLQAGGVRVLLLKGAALALTVYERFADRPMADLDLLVDPDDALRAQSLLMQAGWRSGGEADHEAFYREHQHLPPLREPGSTGITVEVHTDLFFQGHPFLLDREALWRQAEQVRLGSLAVAVPSPTHAVVHLCLHFAWSHMATRGAWRTFRDLHALHDRGRIGWDAVVASAREARASTCAYWTMHLAHRLAAFPVPAEVLRELAPPVGERTLQILTRHFETGLLPMVSTCPSAKLSKWMWEVAIQPRRSGHGEARPWQRDEVVAAAFERDEAARGMEKLRLHLRHLPLWRHYLSSLLLDSRPAPTGT